MYLYILVRTAHIKQKQRIASTLVAIQEHHTHAAEVGDNPMNFFTEGENPEACSHEAAQLLDLFDPQEAFGHEVDAAMELRALLESDSSPAVLSGAPQELSHPLQLFAQHPASSQQAEPAEHMQPANMPTEPIPVPANRAQVVPPGVVLPASVFELFCCSMLLSWVTGAVALLPIHVSTKRHRGKTCTPPAFSSCLVGESYYCTYLLNRSSCKACQTCSCNDRLVCPALHFLFPSFNCITTTLSVLLICASRPICHVCDTYSIRICSKEAYHTHRRTAAPKT